MSHAETHYETYLIHRAEKAENKLQQVRTHIDDPPATWTGLARTQRVGRRLRHGLPRHPQHPLDGDK